MEGVVCGIMCERKVCSVFGIVRGCGVCGIVCVCVREECSVCWIVSVGERAV